MKDNIIKRQWPFLLFRDVSASHSGDGVDIMGFACVQTRVALTIGTSRAEQYNENARPQSSSCRNRYEHNVCSSRRSSTVTVIIVYRKFPNQNDDVDDDDAMLY